VNPIGVVLKIDCNGKRTVRKGLYLTIAVSLVAFFIFLSGTSGAQSAEEWLTQGDVSFKKGDFTAALSSYTEAVGIDGTNPEAFRKRGSAYGRLELYDEAIADFTRAIELLPTDAAAYYGRGINYYSLGQNDLALPDFKAACELGDELACKIYGILRRQ
jgi:tetratricopeptide (TPR) repeat protein